MRNFKISIAIFSIACVSSLSVLAGNNDRAGEAGSSQLLVNPWAKSVGFGGANSASITGLEAMSLNIAGLAFTRKTELLFTHKDYLSGSDTDINSFGFAQKIGETGVIGLSVMTIGFGDIAITTEDEPEGSGATFKPNLTTIDVGYSKRFSNSISGGLAVKIVSESISNYSARGVAFDAGIRYVTGENDQLKFGIALRNVGPTTTGSGDGVSFSNITEVGGVEVRATQDRRVASFQLPSLLNIGLSYDFYVTPQIDSTSKQIKSQHRVTVAGNFTANSFTNDQYRIGVEYAFKEMFMLRSGYVLESDTWFDSSERVTANKGVTFGASLVAPLGKKGTTLGFHYAYQLTESFDGTHSIGVKLDL